MLVVAVLPQITNSLWVQEAPGGTRIVPLLIDCCCFVVVDDDDAALLTGRSTRLNKHGWRETVNLVVFQSVVVSSVRATKIGQISRTYLSERHCTRIPVAKVLHEHSNPSYKCVRMILIIHPK